MEKKNTMSDGLGKLLELPLSQDKSILTFNSRSKEMVLRELFKAPNAM